MKSVVATLLVLALVGPASAQIGGKIGQLGKVLQKGEEVVDDMTFTDAEEQDLGAQLSQKLCMKYGVVQDKPIHKYVTLVGSLLAASSTRPSLAWKFVVLDTSGINAFAAPGGYIHITRGALALIQNEAELADVLGHEIAHVTLKHTISAINNANKKSMALKGVSKLTGQQKVAKVLDTFYKTVLENAYSREDELHADEKGIELANRIGYAPNSMSAFLTRLNDRYKDQPDRSGLYASHPEMQARLDAITQQIASANLSARALVAPRYGQSVAPLHLAALPPVPAKTGASSGTGSTLGISGLLGSGKQLPNNQSVSSAGSRGVNIDRDAPGGPVKTAVVVTVTAAELADFKKGIVG